jgi:hypothetical protein
MAEFLEAWANRDMTSEGKEVPNDRQASSGQQNPNAKIHSTVSPNANTSEIRITTPSFLHP